MKPGVCRVRKVRRETGDTFTLELDPPNGKRAFRFEPGQFNMLYAFGVGEAAISISGDQGEPGVLHQVYVSMERNMKCAVGLCGHCQFGSAFVCRDGPVFRHDQVHAFLDVREV